MTQNLDYVSHWPCRPCRALLAGRRPDRDSATLCVTSARRCPCQSCPFPGHARPPGQTAPGRCRGRRRSLPRQRPGRHHPGRLRRDPRPPDRARRRPRPVAALTPEDYAAVMARWGGAAAATWNRHLSALASFTAWAAAPGDPGHQPRPAPGAPQARPPRRPGHPARPPGEAVHRRPRTPCASGCCGGCSTRLPPGPRRSSPSTSRTSTWSSAAPASPPRAAPSSTCTGPPRTARLLPRLLRRPHRGPVFLADRRAPAAGPPRARQPATSARPPGGAGCPTRAPSTCSSRPPAALDPHRAGLDPAPAAPLRAPAPGRRRPHRSRAPGQVPPPAPGQPRPLRPPRRADLRPRHRRSRPGRPPPRALTSTC